MKTIIISDIHSNSETIIPYGLRVGRAFETETDVLHIIDSRLHQGKYSSASDSQSITPGNKFSQKEIMEREKGIAWKKMDKILSAEASRLNYPLKVNRVIVENTVEEEIVKRAGNEKTTIFVISKEPDGTIFQSLEEILSLVKKAGAIAVIVPPKKEYTDWKKIVFPVEFDQDEITRFTNVKFVMDKFEPLVNVVSATKDKNYLNMQLKSETWAKNAIKLFLPASVKTNVLEGKDFAETITKFVNRNRPDLVMMFRKKQNLAESIFPDDAVGKIAKQVNVPVWICFRK
jgi:nucleotide-binding universal stress UspA family protein